MSFQHALFASGGGGKLNFEPQEFHSENFSVDEFIQRKRPVVPLDVLKDDLGSHLKCLRSSLIELINKDYGQFVNLSSNLVGLDGRIQSIVGPLTRIKNDLQGYDELLNTNIMSLSEALQRRRELRDGKAQVQFHRMAAVALDSSEKLIHKLPPEIVSSMDFNMLRNTCDEVAEAKFLLVCCSQSQLQEQMLKRWNVICNSVLSRLNNLSIIYVDVCDNKPQESMQLASESVTIIKSLLYMYTELQCEPVVEDVLVKNVLVPKCETILSKKGNIGALFDAVESFLKQPLFTDVWKNLTDLPWMAKYDFVTTGIFPCILGILCRHFPHIWSPSNPETFHSNWTRCEKFIIALEESMPSLDHLQKFRTSEPIKEFISKWQFPVYFQLRFHALATELESTLETIPALCATTDFKLDATRVMVKVLNQCWDTDKIYISRISGRFLKASALIVSRYIKEIQKEVASNKNCSLHISINAYCDLRLAELVVRQILTEKMGQEMNFVVPLLPLSENMQPDPSAKGCDVTNNAMQFLSGFGWDEAKEGIENNLIDVIVSQSSSCISAVNEVPRLYRRTNREAPTKQLEYIEGILTPISTLKNDIYNAHQRDLWEKVGVQICKQILQRYKTQVQDVLVSVQKMEESLRRLKKAKGQNQTTSNDNSKSLTDDDKIRLQVQLDVEYFIQKIKEICPSVEASPIQSLFGNANGKT